MRHTQKTLSVRAPGKKEIGVGEHKKRIHFQWAFFQESVSTLLHIFSNYALQLSHFAPMQFLGFWKFHFVWHRSQIADILIGSKCIFHYHNHELRERKHIITWNSTAFSCRGNSTPTLWFDFFASDDVQYPGVCGQTRNTTPKYQNSLKSCDKNTSFLWAN